MHAKKAVDNGGRSARTKVSEALTGAPVEPEGSHCAALATVCHTGGNAHCNMVYHHRDMEAPHQ